MRASSETSPRAAGSVKFSLRRERSHRQAPDSPTTVLKSLPKRVSWSKRHGRPRLALGQRSNTETALSNENGLPSLGNLVWALPRPPISSPLPLVESGPSAPADDTELIARVARAYTSAAAAHPGTGSFWTAFNDGVKRDIHINCPALILLFGPRSYVGQIRTLISGASTRSARRLKARWSRMSSFSGTSMLRVTGGSLTPCGCTVR